MKHLRYIAVLLITVMSFTSCATTSELSKGEIAGYTLKNKKELMHQKIMRTSQETVIAHP
ncbi:hypothetical protein [Altibacter sp. HG106]|uniref:hypothetical protein n=1 Tax=Altibacter sp. HG106 TaxID=3023937 RepID=UPI002350BD55|nr:hypothetical protein [Altibacter sp. HG106]MDC7994610.1 hypothetical protein [Altibacter sp. HG106]